MQQFLCLVKREIILDEDETGRGNKEQKVCYSARTGKAKKFDQRHAKGAREI